MENKKTTLFVILGCILLIGITISFAYYLASIQGEGKNITLKTKTLKITFTESNNLSGENIAPGWSKTSTFTVKNEGKGSYSYNIVIKDLINTFATTGFLQYKITSTDGGYNMTDFKDIPKSSVASNKKLATNITIEENGTHTYTILFTYKNSEDNQAEDMGKILSGQIIIDEYTVPTLAEKLLEDNPTISTRTNFSAPFTETNTGTLFKSTESIAGSTPKDVYYFAGDAKNNWVKFAGYYWRIIRTNHDGSVRMLYAGTSPDTTEGYIGSSAFNTEFNSPKYVGYMYGEDDSTLEGIRANTKDSTIKTYIDNWYSNNLSAYTKYLSKEAVYCNDRELDNGQTWTYATNQSSQIKFIGYSRIDRDGNGAKANPTYNCSNNKDAFSGSNVEAKLKYPIALITADELEFAGASTFNALVSPYTWYYNNSKGESIVNDKWWFTMTPLSFVIGKAVQSYVWDVAGKVPATPGRLGNGYVHGVVNNEVIEEKARPVISIKGNLIWKSGDGSSAYPYEVEDLPPTLNEKLLADNPTIKTRTEFSATYTETNTGTLYKSTESIAGSTPKDVYYFAGDAKNNWVKFANFYWRIIRTNHDGSVRLLYAGTSPDTTEGYIGSSAFNTEFNSPKYVGYMYGEDDSTLDGIRANTKDSTIKTYIDNWYSNNLSAYTKYLSKEAVYCNDRELAPGAKYDIGDTTFYYAARGRLNTNKAPTYSCTNKKDAFSGSNGEAKLTYPVGLMTADEIAYAGGKAYTEISNSYAWYFLNSTGGNITESTWWWLLSPSYWNGSTLYVWYIHSSEYPGRLSNGSVSATRGVRPVVSLKSCTLWSQGDGAANNPYEIEMNGVC